MQNAELNNVVNDAENNNPSLIPLNNAQKLEQLHDDAYQQRSGSIRPRGMSATSC